MSDSVRSVAVIHGLYITQIHDQHESNQRSIYGINILLIVLVDDMELQRLR